MITQETIEKIKDHPVLNYRNRGTWLAHGALIENIKIAAGDRINKLIS